jgi:hypothetical protein
VRRTSVTAFSAANGECGSTSDIPCHRTRPRPKPLVDTTRTASAAASSKDNGFPGSGCLPSTSARSAPLTRRLKREPATRNQGLRRPGRASDASSPPANGRLDTAAFADSSPASARRHAPLVDFCNQTVRKHDPNGSTKLQAFEEKAPRLSSRSSFSAWTRWPPCEGAGPRSHGSEAGVPLAMPAGSPRCDCSRPRALPQPNRLGHPVSRVRGLRGWSGHDTFRTRRRAALSRLATHAGFHRRGKGRLPKPSAKKASFRRTRGAFHPRTSPWRGGAFFSTHCPQSVDYGPCAFSILARSGTLTRARGPRRLEPLVRRRWLAFFVRFSDACAFDGEGPQRLR